MIEILSDTGLGKEMHSVVSQGRVEEIVTSKPRDRRMLIEEAAGLGKHRKRRRRAQLKLERTQDNLDRALDVEREARTRLKPLKRQAEAAELHERIERQIDEARWTLARDGARVGPRGAGARPRPAVAAARAAADADRGRAGGGRRAPRGGRGGAVRALVASASALSSRFYSARSSAERIAMRLDAASRAAAELAERAARRRGVDRRAWRPRPRPTPATTAPPSASPRCRPSSAQLAEDYRDAPGARARRARGRAARPRPRWSPSARRSAGAAAARRSARAKPPPRPPARARRELDTAAEKARRESARIGAELAKVNQFLRANAGAPGGATALADVLSAAPGYELALTAALGPRLRAAVAADLGRRRRAAGARRARTAPPR